MVTDVKANSPAMIQEESMLVGKAQVPTHPTVPAIDKPDKAPEGTHVWHQVPTKTGSVAAENEEGKKVYGSQANNKLGSGKLSKDDIDVVSQILKDVDLADKQFTALSIGYPA